MLHDMDAETEQTPIVSALTSGTATGDDRPLRRIDTHMSHLFLGETRVYKLKQSRLHPFADMSSLEARRRACEAELAVNRALAPDLYEAVAPVVRGEDGAIQVGGVGEVVDWVVSMRRFPDGALLAEMADTGRLTTMHISQAVDVVAAFHAQLPARFDLGHAVDYHRILQGLRETDAEGAAALGVQPASESLFRALDRELTRQSPRIEARRKAGWVRRGHGDLHLRNICLFGGRVTPFDALEFDPALATSDLIYDVAFLLMDLRARGLDDLANSAMNRYWEALGQPEDALALLPLFMALRAAVRMAVAVEAGDLVQAARYRELALDLLRPRPPRLLAIGGLSGTGKSTLARAVASALPGPCGARVMRTDVLRKTLSHVGPTARLSSQAYTPEERASVYRRLAVQAHEALGAGSSVIADATFREEPARRDIEDAAHGHAFLGLWLKASSQVRTDRVAAREDDASDVSPAIARAQVEPDGLGVAWRVLDAERPIETLAAEARELLARPGPDRLGGRISTPAAPDA